MLDPVGFAARLIAQERSRNTDKDEDSEADAEKQGLR
jgi:hypothetical protein